MVMKRCIKKQKEKDKKVIDLSLDELKELVNDVIEWEEKQKNVEDVAFPILGVVEE